MTSIQVLAPGWHVPDGEPEVQVGEVWTARIEVKPARPASSEAWQPDVVDAYDGSDPMLRPIAGVAAGYEFTATATVTGRRWTVLAIDSLRMAVPSLHDDAVSGRGVFVHDTHFIDEPEIISALEIPLLAERIRWAAPRSPLLAVDETVELRELDSTYDQVVEGRSTDGTFMITGHLVG
ncbi:hypothetical protein [Euzebya tangerina]|uniref:hypothetical protein n=1 Tax=Euzebya tangerina TaxID=591198 RepID=UPI000E31507B|nr:hypothetical protein [Euzebya tangerina]